MCVVVLATSRDSLQCTSEKIYFQSLFRQRLLELTVLPFQPRVSALSFLPLGPIVGRQLIAPLVQHATMHARFFGQFLDVRAIPPSLYRPPLECSRILPYFSFFPPALLLLEVSFYWRCRYFLCFSSGFTPAR
jgi:hypothetical protein